MLIVTPIHHGHVGERPYLGYVRPSPGLGGATPALVFTQLTPERGSTLPSSQDPKKPQKVENLFLLKLQMKIKQQVDLIQITL